MLLDYNINTHKVFLICYNLTEKIETDEWGSVIANIYIKELTIL